MRHKKKIIVSILVLISLIFLIALFVSSNYLLDFALVRTETFDEKINPDSSAEHSEMRKYSEKGRLWAENINQERVEITSGDGLRLVGTLYQNDSHDYAILVHGYKAHKEDMQYTASFYYSWGYNVLTPVNRAHGESEGKYVGMGWLDAKDVLNWIDLILSMDNSANIVLHGVSMGGATVMMASGYDLPSNVKAIVEDCGYSSVWDIFSDELKALFSLPEFPLLYVASWLSDIRVGYSFKEASSLKQLSKTDIPMLFIHGTEDNFVGYYMLDLNSQAKTKGPKEVLRIEGAGHAMSNIVNPELYYGTIKEFLSLYNK